MPAQTTYSQTMATAIAGMLADLRDHTVESFAAQGGDIPFGLAVVPGTDLAKQVKLPTAAGQGFRGVALHEQAQEQALSTGVVAYKEHDAVNVLRKGLVWVLTAGAVAADAAAFYVNSGSGAGRFDDLDDSTTDPVPTGVFRSATTGSGLALLEINLP